MMQIGLHELNHHSTRVANRVRNGETIEITDQRLAIAATTIGLPVATPQ